jgi:hypothetical protein
MKDSKHCNAHAGTEDAMSSESVKEFALAYLNAMLHAKNRRKFRRGMLWNAIYDDRMLAA